MPNPPPDAPRRANPFARRLPAAVVFGMLLAYSAIQAPVPAVNEPQYLGKAKHFWDPAWCPGDFFLDSSNPHLFFYVAVGWLTRLVSLDATAWIARVAGYGLLAAGWTALGRRVAGSSWAAVPSAAVFLLLASLANLSGEWLVGGIEGKVFAYALLFFAIPFWLDDRPTVAAACLGGAVSFHPIVGGWGLICGAIAEAATWLLQRRRKPRAFRVYLVPALVFLVCALPGLIPAAFTLVGSTPRDAARATYIQVFIRLRHHLDPTQFPLGCYAVYAVLLAEWLALRFLTAPRRDEPSSPLAPREDAHRWFTAFVLAAAAVAIAGVAIGWHAGDAWTMPLRDLRGTLLKFYPFRLADVFIPLALSFALARLVAPRRSLPPAGGGIASTDAPPPRLVPSLLLTILAFTASLTIPSPDRNPSRLSPAEFAAWTDVARWIREHTPADALIVSPSGHWGFKWFADRAEYVNYKDAPQDTPSLLEWERRLDVLKDWWESSPTGFYSTADLRTLGKKTGAAYFVTRRGATRFAARPLYDNGVYRVYRLR
jgi:hypothetical protein